MTSKYDSFWRSQLHELTAAVGRAAVGDTVRLDVSDMRQLGHRSSWYGLVTVTGGRLGSAHMAHAKALGRLVIDEGLTDAWPDREFRFSINVDCSLTITTRPTGLADQVPAPVAQSHRLPPPTMPVSELAAVTDAQMDPSIACRRIHESLTLLPNLRTPDQVGFTNGLYFFFEEGERSSYSSDGRVVRVGNHPRSPGRLVGRLSEHYRTARNAKNGSVFRRYLGSAMLRRSNPHVSCLQPSPGVGHWEHGHQLECDMCAPIEREVTEYLASKMQFRVVRIVDQSLRNEFEKKLIASLAACTICAPSPGWLGRFCYQAQVVRSGLWNDHHTTGPGMTEADLYAFETLIRDTARSVRVRDSTNRRPTLSDTLLIIPCSSSKKGAAVARLPSRQVADFLPEDMARVLEEGRRLAFDRPGVTLVEQSQPEPALAVYTGQPYATAGFRDGLVSALERGLHCLIVSGGYGLVRPEEPIKRYSAHLPTHTRSVWTRRLRLLLPSYVEQNQIRRVLVSVSNSYASCLPRGFAREEWWGVPTFERHLDEGSPMQVVPRRVGRMIVDLLDEDLVPGDGWSRLDT